MVNLNYRVVPDDIMTQILIPKLNELEKKQENYIVVGYPQTRAQAITLRKIGLIPEIIFVIKTDESTVKKRLNEMMQNHKEEAASANIDTEQRIINAGLEYLV